VPSWDPNWEDVVFDRAAAGTAAAECRSAATVAREVRTGLDGARTAARQDWTGPYADDFDAEEPAVGADLDIVAGDLESLASDLETASEDARTEQGRREADRERWREELVRELAARDDALARRGPIPQ